MNHSDFGVYRYTLFSEKPRDCNMCSVWIQQRKWVSDAGSCSRCHQEGHYGMLDLNRFSTGSLGGFELDFAIFCHGNFQRCWTLDWDTFGGLSLHFHGHGPQEVMVLGFNFRPQGLNDSQLCTREICVWQSRDSKSRG